MFYQKWNVLSKKERCKLVTLFLIMMIKFMKRNNQKNKINILRNTLQHIKDISTCTLLNSRFIFNYVLLY